MLARRSASARMLSSKPRLSWITTMPGNGPSPCGCPRCPIRPSPQLIVAMAAHHPGAAPRALADHHEPERLVGGGTVAVVGVDEDRLRVPGTVGHVDLAGEGADPRAAERRHGGAQRDHAAEVDLVRPGTHRS